MKLNESLPSPTRHTDVLKKYDINMQQELFCQYYTSPTEFYGNGVQSYAAAYNIDISNPAQYNSARARASGLLTHVNILRRINDLIESGGFNDQNADRQLYFLMAQSADFHAKLGAIREYNKLKKRIVDKIELIKDGPVTAINITPMEVPNREAEDTVVEQIDVEQSSDTPAAE